jgi:Replication initiation factor
MGVHVVTSGAVLDMFPIPPEEYLKSLILHHAVITRLDLAIDARNCNLRPQKATERIKANACRTRSRKFPCTHDAVDSGYTQYIGKKSSACCVRIYDKAAESGVVGDYTRVEIVFKAGRAHSAAQAAARGEDYRALVRSFVDFLDWKEWDKVFDVAPVRIYSEQKDTNTQKWLLQVAAASLAREIHLAGDDDFYFRFQDAVRVKLEELRERYDNEKEQVG